MTLAQRWCGVRRGHDEVMQFERTRVSIRCATCGYDSPGVTTGGRAPRQTYAGDPQRHRLYATVASEGRAAS